MSNKLHNFAAFLSGIVTDRGLPMIFRTLLSRGADVVQARVEKAINQPTDFLQIVLQLEGENRKNFLALLRRAKKQGVENELVLGLVGGLPTKQDGTIDKEAALKVLTGIGEADLDDIEPLLEVLRHNPILQHLIHDLGHLAKSVERLMILAASAAGTTVKGFDALDEWAEKKAKELEETWFGSLADKLFLGPGDSKKKKKRKKTEPCSWANQLFRI